ncbi:flagellar basal body-associated FliL family protein [Thermovenabulum gondwanense]|uniref:Flagellar protein FliL n=1 Tax=Thermovenabulum gondwanense TaxID=520767 RepID=A0A161Q9W5_9FIRM|nr:flagellar basal body-associated FliL family protein [Thermovenabulum gondwanense]KYO64578.1 hypothetical protein ATZ99_20140 [Thermovenabulum gondwanense]
MAEMAQKKGMRRILIIVFIVVILMIVSAFMAYFLTKNFLFQDKAKEEKKVLAPYQAGEFLTNLADHGYIKISLVFLLEGKDAEKELKQREYEINDRIYSILRAKTFESVKNSNGMEVLRGEIKNNINKLLEKAKIVDVYFNSIIVN